MLTDFYVAFATVCFTLLGLWIIVVQTRHAEWRQSAVHRRRAYGVALHFSLPGLMSLLSLIDPASTALWRISFAIVAAGGVIALALVRGPAPTGLGAAAYVAAVVLYVLIALVAVAPGMVAEIGVLALPLRVEAVLLTILVFLGVNVAWLLLFDQAQPPSALEDPTQPGRNRRLPAARIRRLRLDLGCRLDPVLLRPKGDPGPGFCPSGPDAFGAPVDHDPSPGDLAKQEIAGRCVGGRLLVLRLALRWRARRLH
jgi:hypothetical protein